MELLLLIIIVGIAVVWSVPLDCDLVQFNHPRIPGIGILAGRNFAAGEVVERVMGLVIPDELLDGSILWNYAFDHNTETSQSALNLGYAAVYNHLPEHESNLELLEPKACYDSPRIDKTSGVLVDMAMSAKRDIRRGEEMYITYGSQKWFDDRGIKMLDRRSVEDGHVYSIDSVHTTPGCFTTLTEIVEGRMYAAQFIKEGEIIEVSRALLVPDGMTKNQTLNKFPWYEEHSNSGMILLGGGAFYQAVDPTNPSKCNIVYSFYEPPLYDKADSNIVSSWAKFVEAETALIAITARRDIEPNEELLLPFIIDTETGQRRVFNRILPLR